MSAEDLIRDMRNNTNRGTYCGADPCWCLVGQRLAQLDYVETWGEGATEFLAGKYDVPHELIAAIDVLAGRREYANDVDAALDMAEKVLLTGDTLGVRTSYASTWEE